MRVIVIVPTYNEAENIEPLCRRILEVEPRAEVLVVEDNSPDGTGEIADRLAAETPRVHVLHREGKLGLGTAHLAGYRYGLDHGYDRIITMDADFSHPPERIPALIELTETHDVAVGSRYVPGGGVENWPLKRKILSGGANLLTRIMLRLPVHDCTGAFRCFRAESLARLDLGLLKSVGYSFQEEMMWLVVKSGLTVGETPIIFVDRKQGKSKVSYKEIRQVFMTLLRLMFAPKPKPKSGP